MIRNKPKPNVLYSQLAAAAEVWELIRGERMPADRFLGNYFRRFRKKFGARDRRFISETVYALFRRKSFLEAWAETFGSQSDPHLLVLMAAACEGLVSTADFPPHLCPLPPGGEGWVRGELPPGKIFNSAEDELALRYSCPAWIVRRWLKNFGEEKTVSILASFEKRPALVVRANTIKISREKLIERFRELGHETRAAAKSSCGIRFEKRANLFDAEEFREGFFEIQDEGSQIVTERVAAKPGEVIWDVCAGGGGKTLHLAAQMRNKGRIIATDIREKKLEELRRRARRAGVMNIFPAELKRLDEIPFMKKGVDKILIDAPCSGTGTFRRNPDAKWKLAEEDLAGFHREQAAILSRALPYLRKGGKIFYVTCSLEPEENEDVVREVLGEDAALFRLFPDEGETDGFFLAAADKR